MSRGLGYPSPAMRQLGLVLAASLLLAATSLRAEEPLPAVARLVEGGRAVLVDVRSEREWKAGHLAKAIWIPVDLIARGTADLSPLPKDRPVYLHCAVGPRARYAARVLKEKGYDARPLDAGPAALEKAGLAAAK